MSNSQYYLKYLKYKQKYLNLKQQGGEPFTDINNNLYLKFITEKLVALIPDEIIIRGNKKRRNEIPDEDAFLGVPVLKAFKYPTRIREPSRKFADYVQDLTPQIMRYLSPMSRARLEDDIKIDNIIIKKLEDVNEIEDPAYIVYENYGKLIEAWIADNMCCPACHSPNSLRRYLSDSMPVIDLVCINPEHTLEHGVRFFQVKTSGGGFFAGEPYFNYDKLNPDSNIIHVGSIVWGKPVHTIKPSDSLFAKKILCGYICISYFETDTNLQIDLTKSMIVLPEYLLAVDPIVRVLTFADDTGPDIDNTWYYCYTTPHKSHQRIKFNLLTNRIISASELRDYLPNILINKSYIVRTDSMLNPLSVVT